MKAPQTVENTNGYRGIGRLFYIVRWSQHLLAIITEILILISFAMSGMDVSLGGIMASVAFINGLWAAMFALGEDTAFALSWVRPRHDTPDRELGKLSELAAATAKKHRETLKTQVTPEGEQ
jgi:hypothetical protein